jgi:microcin C transport system permease protein
MRLLGIAALLLAALAATGERYGLALPTAHWLFTVSREVPWLHAGTGGQVLPWFGWLGVGVLAAGGLALVSGSVLRGPANPITVRRIKRFRRIRRGYWSFLILLGLLGLAALDHLLVGKTALAVRQQGRWEFPAFKAREWKGRDFGLTGEAADGPVDFRTLRDRFRRSDPPTAGPRDLVIMPPIPFDPTGDTLAPRSRPMVERDGRLYAPRQGVPYSGLVARLYDVDSARMHLRYRMRDGRFDGPADGWDEQGNPVYTATWRAGELVEDRYVGQGTKEEFLARDTGRPRIVFYHPAPPLPEQGHWLGTTSQGYDVVAYLFGGLQVNFKAAMIYLPVVYLIGITLGLMMGYFGGWFDLVVQRLIEVFSEMPYLFIVIIVSSLVPENMKGLPVILTILVAFGWMGMTYLMRTAALREKARDYVAAARVLGAGTPRVIFRHLLPNTVAIIVTLVPFSMSGLIFALTALDYLGFGLPPDQATWGRLLNDGLSNLSAPWLVSSAFVVLVLTLVLITFVGEAVREAFDPKKFTYYR